MIQKLLSNDYVRYIWIDRMHIKFWEKYSFPTIEISKSSRNAAYVSEITHSEVAFDYRELWKTFQGNFVCWNKRIQAQNWYWSCFRAYITNVQIENFYYSFYILQSDVNWAFPFCQNIVFTTLFKKIVAQSSMEDKMEDSMKS